MAIFEDVPGLSVVVKVDGLPAAEYDDDDEEGVVADNIPEHKAAVTVSKYIESISEKEYTVELKATKAFNFNCPALQCTIKVDGKFIMCPILRRDSFANEMVVFSCEGAEENTDRGHTFLNKFRFGKIDVNENNVQNIKKDSVRVAKVGDIVVEFFRASQPVALPKEAGKPETLATLTNIHEKAMKGQAKSHSTVFGPRVSKPYRSYVSCEKLDGDHPITIFRFRYRSREALKQLLVLPRTPSPEPEPSPPPNPMNIEGLDDEQREQLEKFLKELTGANQPARIKRERNQDGNNENAQKRRKSGKKVTIDLTADSDDEN